MKIKPREQLSAPKQNGLNKAKSQTNIFLIWKKGTNRKVIKSLKRPDGALICDEVEILKVIN